MPSASNTIPIALSGPAAALLITVAVSACSTPAPTQQRAVSVSSGNCQQPSYPLDAKRDGAEGVTGLDFEVDAVGKVTRVAIINTAGTTEGHRALDTIALESLKKCVFPPAPGYLPGRARLDYVWRLQD